ncbi:hypothetical protein V6N13_111346, partial [Hibiscus sabdariffa]
CNAIFNPVNTHQEDILTRGHRLFEECNYASVGTPSHNPFAMVPRASSRTPSGWVQNNIADRLATLGRSSSRCGLLLSSPPADLFVLVEEEKEQSAGEPVLTQNWRVTANVVCFNLHSDSGG